MKTPIGTNLVEPRILNSWKEIADYLDRGIRTVQRWEQDLNLPIHRIGKGKRSPVFANVAELNLALDYRCLGAAQGKATGDYY